MSKLRRVFTVALITLALAGLTGCQQAEDTAEETGEAIEDAGEEAGDAAEEAGDEAEDAMD